jgi:hypothetical protein
MNELPIIQKTYDFIHWYIPILNRIPRNHRFTLGNRIINNLYDLLEELIKARFAKGNKILLLQAINNRLDIMRYQTRLLYDFHLLNSQRYEYANQQIDDK